MPMPALHVPLGGVERRRARTLRCRAVVPGLPALELGQRPPALFEPAALRVRDAPVERRAEDRLRLHHDGAQLAVLELAELLHAREELLVAQMPLAEVPADDRAGDVLAVEVAVLLERTAVDRLRDQQPERASLEVQRAEREPPALRERRLRGEQLLELLLEERRRALQPVEVLLAFAGEQPRVPGPVPGVVAHRDQERDLRANQVPEEWQADQRGHEPERERRR